MTLLLLLLLMMPIHRARAACLYDPHQQASTDEYCQHLRDLVCTKRNVSSSYYIGPSYSLFYYEHSHLILQYPSNTTMNSSGILCSTNATTTMIQMAVTSTTQHNTSIGNTPQQTTPRKAHHKPKQQQQQNDNQQQQLIGSQQQQQQQQNTEVQALRLSYVIVGSLAPLAGIVAILGVLIHRERTAVCYNGYEEVPFLPQKVVD